MLVVRVPSHDSPVVASIIGQNGEEYGLSLTLGEHAVDQVRQLYQLDREAEEHLDVVWQVGYSIGPLWTVHSELRGPLELAGVQAHRQRLVPCLISCKPGRQPRSPHMTEMRILLEAIQLLLRALDQGEFEPTSAHDAGPVTLLTMRATAEGPRVSGERFDPGPPSFDLPPLPADSLDPSLPRLKERWVIAAPRLPAGIKGDDRSVHALIVVHDGPRRLVVQDTFFSDQFETAAARILAAFRGANEDRRPGLPAGVVFLHRGLLQRLAPLLAEVDVPSELGQLDDHPAFADLIQALIGEGSPFEHIESSIDPDDLEGWKRADRAACEILVERVEASGRDGDRARSRYFGTAERADELLDAGHDLMAEVAYYEWLFAWYRPHRNSKSVLERELPRLDLPAPIRLLLERRADARVSLFRIQDVIPGLSFEALDIATGESFRVMDHLLSQSVDPGLCIPLRLIPAGDFLFPGIAGPPLPSGRVSEALVWLERQGLPLIPENLRDAPHLLGRLWAYYVDCIQNAPPPQLCNTDGDPLEWHTALFTVEDRRKVLVGLERRPDVEYDEEDRAHRWLQRQNSTLLGTIRLRSRDLTVEVNSARRYEECKAWLTRIPGVRLKKVTHRAIESLADLPSTKPLPSVGGGPSPDLLQSLAEMIREQSFAWLDESIPALKQQTPRHAVQAAAGRRRVAQLIRAMADVPGPDGTVLPVPREEMLRELGIAEEGRGAGER
jgi:hypothetical protein